VTALQLAFISQFEPANAGDQSPKRGNTIATEAIAAACDGKLEE